MMAQTIDRKQVKYDIRQTLQTAQVSPTRMVLFYLLINLALNLLDALSSNLSFAMAGMFVSVLVGLMGLVLTTGFSIYCMTILRGERAEYLTLFDGFGFVGKLISLYLVQYIFIFFWSMLFIIPGIIAAYRYRFAVYNLIEDPELHPFQALEMSKRQTQGYKMQLVMLDLSYLPWLLLASLPAFILDGTYFAGLMSANLSGLAASAAAVSPLAATAIVSVWALVVGPFYYPHLICADLEYFRIAKTTSGISAGNRSQDDLLPPSSDDEY